MEDSLNRNYVNISNKVFEHKVYNNKESSVFSYKPLSAYWLSLESNDENYYSEWDEKYRDVLETDNSGNLHATVVKFKPTTFFMSPDQHKTLLEGFHKFTAGQNLSPDQKRHLLVELVRTHLNKPEIESVICQIDLLEDMQALEEIYGGFKIGNKHPDELYKNLAIKVKNGIKEDFSGLEVTAYALGIDKTLPSDGVGDTQIYWSSIDSKYDETIDYFDMHSVAVFDTSCLNIVREIVYPQKTKEIQEKDIDEL